jgi:hypothetical protein
VSIADEPNGKFVTTSDFRSWTVVLIRFDDVGFYDRLAVWILTRVLPSFICRSDSTFRLHGCGNIEMRLSPQMIGAVGVAGQMAWEAIEKVGVIPDA